MFQQEPVNKVNDLTAERAYQQRLSSFGEDLDFGVLMHLIRKSVFWIIGLLVVAFVLASLYLRYTPPTFRSSSIMQIKTNSDERKMLNLHSDIDANNLPRVVELMRSKEFFKRVLSNLPLQYNYYSEGTFIASELFTSSPYSVQIEGQTDAMLGVKFYVTFEDQNKGVVNYTYNDKVYNVDFKTGVWSGKSDFRIKITVHNYDAILYQQTLVKSNSFYFSINKIDRLVEQYYDRLQVKVLNGEAGTIQITFDDHNATKAAAIVSMMSSEYDSFELEQRGGSTLGIIDFINEQLEDVYQKLKQAEIALLDFKSKNNISDLPEKSPIDNKVLIGNIENQIIALDLENTYLNKLQVAAKNYNKSDSYSLVGLLGSSSNQKFQSYSVDAVQSSTILNSNLDVSELQALLVKKEEMLYSITPESEVVKSVDFQINIQLKVLIENIRSIRNNNELRRRDLKDKLFELNRLSLNNDRKSGLAESSLEYTRLQRSFSINEKYYMQLIEKKTSISISHAGFVSQNIILQKGKTADTPLAPNATTVYFSCLIGALILSVTLVLIRYFLHDEIGSLTEITNKLTSVGVLGIVPSTSLEMSNSQLLVDKSPKSAIAESFRSIRSNLQFINNKAGSKLIAVTSTISGEGKTFIAMNLAGIIAFSGKRVLLIDLDMRKPKIHLGFNALNTKGMSTLLIGKDKLEDCIQKSELENLDFITAGPIPPNPSELIISPEMDELLEELKGLYDVIVIDNPPVGIVSDGLAILQKADYPIYIFRADYSKRNFVHNVDRLIYENKMSNLSIILNGVDIDRKTYGYSFGYGYGYGYGTNYGYYEQDSPTKKSFFRK